MLTINDLKFSNQKFWTGFFVTSFPTSLDKEMNLSLSEMIEENVVTDKEWWTKFTKYYDGVLNETDGYIEDPETVICNLTATQTLKIEFHPGDTIYYVNDKQIACTGGEYSIQIFPFADLLKYTEEIKDEQIFFLLLPLVIIKKQEANKATELLSNFLKNIFEERLCNLFANSIVYGLVAE